MEAPTETSTVDYRFGSSHLEVNNVGNTFFFFAIDQVTGKAYRDEYCALVIFGVTLLSTGSVLSQLKEQAEITNFTSLELLNNGTIAMLNTTLSSGTKFSMVFDFTNSEYASLRQKFFKTNFSWKLFPGTRFQEIM